MDAVKETADSNNVQVAMGFGYGLRTGTPIAVGYIPSAVACGILCKTAGLTAFESLFMSLVVFAGASQFVALNLIMIGSSFPEIVLATAVLNMRHIMMSSSLARRLVPGIGALKKSWICFELTDESFSIASMQKEPRLAPEFMFGLNIVGHISWVSGTLLGFYGTSVMPQNVQDSMGPLRLILGPAPALGKEKQAGICRCGGRHGSQRTDKVDSIFCRPEPGDRHYDRYRNCRPYRSAALPPG